jgi:hypothetical protein
LALETNNAEADLEDGAIVTNRVCNRLGLLIVVERFFQFPQPLVGSAEEFENNDLIA